MGGSNRYTPNVFATSKAEDNRQFYQHDNRSHPSSSGNNYNGSSRNYNNNRNYSRQPRDDSINNNQSRGGSSNRYINNNLWNHGRGRDRGNYGHGNKRGYGSNRGGKQFSDGDVQMSDSKQGRRQNMYEASRGRGRGKRVYNMHSPVGWHKILIKNAASHDKWSVLRELRSYVDTPFVPILFGKDNAHLCFYLERNGDVANTISDLSGRINHNGLKLIITCFSSVPIVRKLTPEQSEVVKNVLGERYSMELNRLDLSTFHNSPALVEACIYCPLNRLITGNEVLKLVKNNIPGIQELDMRNNSIMGIEFLGIADLQQLQRLSLKDNRIRTTDNLNKLKGCPVTELILLGNPLCNKYKDPEIYTSDVRKIFPKVVKLDGTELAKPIGFEVEDDSTTVPPMKSSYFCSEEVRAIVIKFVEQYYQVFECGNREALAAAYTEDSLISVISLIPSVSNEFMADLARESRNLLKVSSSERRQKLLLKGRKEVAGLLSKLPELTHDPNSFVIDIPMALPSLIHVVMSGVFRMAEGRPNAVRHNVIRHFRRSLVIVPIGSGFCISNEELFFSVATVDQIKLAFQEKKEDVLPVPVRIAPVLTEENQLQLINQFALTSKMLPQFCKMCLEQNAWDYAKAGEMFLNLQKEGKVPPEYFGITT